MAQEIKREPITFEDGEGREFVVFDEDHTHNDIVRYVTDDIGVEDTQMILDFIKDEELENAGHPHPTPVGFLRDEQLT